MANLVSCIDFISMNNWLIINYDMIIFWEKEHIQSHWLSEIISMEHVYSHWLSDIKSICRISGSEKGKNTADTKVD